MGSSRWRLLPPKSQSRDSLNDSEYVFVKCMIITLKGSFFCHHLPSLSFWIPGDIMGTALKNLDSLVQMPKGCGEQNMLLFAPIIYVLQYLQKTGMLTEEIKSQAVDFLRLGELVHSFFLDTLSSAYDR